jgi:copper(I)-binding protein
MQYHADAEDRKPCDTGERRGRVQASGYHIMLSGVHHDLNPGDTVNLRFQFKNSGSREGTATVREP